MTVTVARATSDADIAACLAIRETVFIQEQRVPVEIERDDYDRTAFHFLATDAGDPVGTARVVLKDDGATAKIGRVAVIRAKRGAGIGRLLMLAIEAEPPLHGAVRLSLEAQTHALSFYESLGYEAYGAEFMDAGIPHRHMTKAITAKR
jgi:predicted GNAT family N-acyltransferase